MDTLFNSMMPEVAISVGVSSLVFGTVASCSAINPYVTEKQGNSSTALGLSCSIVGAACVNPGTTYVRDLNKTEAYIQSLSKDELKELSDQLNLINEYQNKEEFIEELRDLTLGDFDETYNQIEKTKKKTIWG